MSGIAGIIYFDGRPIEPGQVEAMTEAMHHRGPDGINHWRKGNVALGQCMLRTTPESLKETQPLTNEDESLVLVMDGRVDNYDELRRELLGRGAVLRTLADAELVLRAFEVWGNDCPDRIIGECVFFIWDTRQQRLFAARDAAGTRHFYYHQGKGWFAFASEIKGLLALPQIERRLNESRLMDYMVVEFDRDDEVGTFYQNILRMPAGNAMIVTATGPRIWRWWEPGELSEQKFVSLEECTEAFMDQLRVAVKCRLRSIKPVGAMLSGGLDSSTIVGLISKEFQGELRESLRTFSLIRDDFENCLDWRSIDAILKADPWLQPTLITSAKADEVWQALLANIFQDDEPFAMSHGFTYGLTYKAARTAGCGVVLDGMAGDLMFYSPYQSLTALAQRKQYQKIPSVLGAYRRHGLTGGWESAVRATLISLLPDTLLTVVKGRRSVQRLGAGDLKMLRPEVANDYLSKKGAAQNIGASGKASTSDQIIHARHFTTGQISFAHETYGLLAAINGVEPRSPFSDQRLMEFAIQMPFSAKTAAPWYKHVLRNGSVGMLPDSVRWRRDVGRGNPSWTFYARLASNVAKGAPKEIWNSLSNRSSAARVFNFDALKECAADYALSGDFSSGDRTLRWSILSQWINSRDLSNCNI